MLSLIRRVVFASIAHDLYKVLETRIER
jgi:hypothetical protein